MLGTKLWRSLFGRAAQERELQDELQHDLAQRIADHERAGLTPKAARRQANIELGGVTQLRESCREVRPIALLESVVQDIRYALRTMRKNPTFSVVAILTLALGIGANTAIYSMMHSLFFRTLPVLDSDALVVPWNTHAARGLTQVRISLADMVAWREQSTTLARIEAATTTNFNLAGAGHPIRVRGQAVTAGFFDTLGVTMAQGRAFLESDARPGSKRVIVLSHGFWQRHFGGDPIVIGSTATLDNAPATIVGITPPEFWFQSLDIDLWTAITIDPTSPDYEAHQLLGLARLEADATIEQASAELATISARRERDDPDTRKGWGARVTPLLNLNPNDRMVITLLVTAVGFLLLIACSNVANLMMARALTRHHEFAVRSAIGATRGRLIRQLIVESTVLSILGTTLGALLAVWSIRGLEIVSRGITPLLEDIPFNLPVFGAVLALGIFSTVLFGLAPTILVSRHRLASSIRQGGTQLTPSRSARRLNRSLVVGEIALSFVLLVVSALLIQTLLNMRRINPGFPAENLLTFKLVVTPEAKTARLDPAPRFSSVITELKRLPDVRNVAAVSHIPIESNGLPRSLEIEGRRRQPDETTLVVQQLVITPLYHETLGLLIRKGRAFNERDTASSTPVTIISQSMADQLWPNEDPLGRRIRFIDDEDQTWIEIIGICEDVRNARIGIRSPSIAHRPYLQSPTREMAILLRTTSDPLAVTPAMMSTIQRLDPEQPVFDLRTMTTVLYQDLQGAHVMLGMFAIFAALAVLLATIGLYGIIAYDVGLRRNEFGIRMALGAKPSALLTRVMRQGLSLCMLGLLIGIAGALAISRVLGSMLYGVNPGDPDTIVYSFALYIAVASFACLIPAWRAMRVDPMTALRCE